jgi:hypothetical protein
MNESKTSWTTPALLRRLLHWTVPVDGVETCECGSQLWLLANDGQCLCNGCRRVSQEVRAIRAKTG